MIDFSGFARKASKNAFDSSKIPNTPLQVNIGSLGQNIMKSSPQKKVSTNKYAQIE